MHAIRATLDHQCYWSNNSAISEDYGDGLRGVDESLLTNEAALDLIGPVKAAFIQGKTGQCSIDDHILVRTHGPVVALAACNGSNMYA